MLCGLIIGFVVGVNIGLVAFSMLSINRKEK